MNSRHVPKKSYSFDDFGSASFVVYESEEFGLVAMTYRDFCANPGGIGMNPKEEFRRANPELFVGQQETKSEIEVSRQLENEIGHRDRDEGQEVVGQRRNSTGVSSGGSSCSGSFGDTTKKLRIGTLKVKPKKELDSIVTEFVTTKHSRTRVFAGAKKSTPIIPVKSLITTSTTTATTLTAKIRVPKLTELSTKIVEANVDRLIGLEKLPTPMLLTLLKKVSGKRLEGIERNNPGIREKTNEVWKMKYSRDFKSMRIQLADETKWRDAYHAAAKERRASFMKSVKVKMVSATSTIPPKSTSNSGEASVSTLPPSFPVSGGRVKSKKESATTSKRKIFSCDDVFSIFAKRDNERHASKCRKLKSRSDSKELPRSRISPAQSAKENLS